ncbi:MAG: hypothetical protein H0X31_11570 [Nostocaceae cyanobacterium]|nr:hypothetical protein [Nostocaceae cyanobacterium]
MAEHHPLGDIRYLRENLLNSYKLGFPILKELVQNAEDAKATCLDYGWIEGIPNAEHPLLQTPALFMLDNGDFTDENAKSIRYILGGSSKPNQSDSIGKFGLGLKSVFHLCEAFFYIAPELENATYRRWDIFNPWAGAENKDEYHKNWNVFSAKDKDKLKKLLHNLLGREDYQEKWFIIWIPLRQRSHCTKKKEEDGISLGWIKNGSDDFFEKVPEFFRNDETCKHLSLLLTLLGKVNKITYWENDLNNAKFEVKLENGFQRRQLLSELKINREHLLQGKISCNEANLVEFAGSEFISDSQEFNRILTSPEFPGKFSHIKPHNAIVFSRLNPRAAVQYK